MRKMKKLILGIVSLCFLFTSLLNAKIIRTCDSFLFLVDESASMQESYLNVKKIEIERDLIKKISENVPDISYLSAMRAFSYKAAYKTRLLYPVSEYNTSKMISAGEKIKSYHQWTSIGYGLYKTEQDLKKMKGVKHLVIFSDGNENATYRAPDLIASELHSKFPNLCIYAVQIGDSHYGKRVLSKIVDAAGCGKLYNADSLNSADGLNNFIKDVFGYVKVEQPKPAPKPKPVVKIAPKDSDKDGVYDEYDKCPGTPIGAPVDSNGCWKIANVYFNFDKYTIIPKYKSLIREIAMVMKKNPGIKLIIKGYTDSFGTQKYNLKLSKERAEMVKKEFIRDSICPCRLIVKYFGEKYPAASNKTKEGRALNRRVEFEILK